MRKATQAELDAAIATNEQRGSENGQEQYTSGDFNMLDMSGCDFRGLNFRGQTIEFVDFDMSDFRGCDMSGTTFWTCNFFGCDFRKVEAEAAAFSECTMACSDFRGANFSLADINHQSNPTECDFRGANMSYMNVHDAEFVPRRKGITRFEGAIIIGWRGDCDITSHSNGEQILNVERLEDGGKAHQVYGTDRVVGVIDNTGD